MSTVEKILRTCENCKYLYEKKDTALDGTVYIKHLCSNRFGLSNELPLKLRDYCSRWERKEK